MIKIEHSFDVSIDFLLLDEAPYRLQQKTKGRLVERILRFEGISDDEERSLLHVIDVLEAKNKLKFLAAEMI